MLACVNKLEDQGISSRTDMSRHSTHQSMVLFNCGQVRVGRNPCTQGEGSDQKGDNGPTRELEWNGEAATEVLQDKVNTDRYGHSCNAQAENSWTGQVSLYSQGDQ